MPQNLEELYSPILRPNMAAEEAANEVSNSHYTSDEMIPSKLSTTPQNLEECLTLEISFNVLPAVTYGGSIPLGGSFTACLLISTTIFLWFNINFCGLN